SGADRRVGALVLTAVRVLLLDDQVRRVAGAVVLADRRRGGAAGRSGAARRVAQVARGKLDLRSRTRGVELGKRRVEAAACRVDGEEILVEEIAHLTDAVNHLAGAAAGERERLPAAQRRAGPGPGHRARVHRDERAAQAGR